MSKILVATVPGSGHVNPMLLIVEELIRRGHEVHWYTGRAFQSKIEAIGAVYEPMHIAFDHGGKEKNKHASKRTPNTQGRSEKTKTPVFALVERGGNVYAQKVEHVSAKTLKGIIRERVSKNATIMTDNYPVYNGLDQEFAGHGVVDHAAGEYVDGDIHTNTVEGWFALLKRGVTGTFHHVSEEHLNRYVDEFTFRYNRRDSTDGERAVMALKKVGGKRLMYKDPTKRNNLC